MTWNTAFAELNASTVDYFGELVNYLSLDGNTAVTGISATLRRTGEDGSALFDMPAASVSVPAFGDSITDADSVVWRISEINQKFSDRTPCTLKRADFWKLVDIEQYITGAWATITSSVYVMIDVDASFEDIDDGFIETKEYTVKTQFMATPTQKMRFKWGSRYLYITGERPDNSQSFYTEWDCTEVEA
jgi:hypothetical protein